MVRFQKNIGVKIEKTVCKIFNLPVHNETFEKFSGSKYLFITN